LALKEPAKKIIKSVGKNAGYSIIREAQEKIGKDYDMMLVNTEQKYQNYTKFYTGIYG
jgi:hypothetical protein